MARRVDILGLVKVGHDITLAWDIDDELTREPVNLSSRDIEFVVRDSPLGALRLQKATPFITFDNYGEGTGNLVRCPIYFSDTFDGNNVLFSGRKHYALRTIDGPKILLAWGLIDFDVAAGYG